MPLSLGLVSSALGNILALEVVCSFIYRFNVDHDLDLDIWSRLCLCRRLPAAGGGFSGIRQVLDYCVFPASVHEMILG
jgi:hypothetical protein